MTFQTPDWVHDAVFYQIFPDRFAQSKRVPKPDNLEPWDSPPTTHGFKGGDLLGVAEHLDYLQDLGITAIYFTPVFRSTANHRYHTHDYYLVDPILGGNAALRTLLDEAHRRGLRVILDGVFNHASRGFYQFNSILENGTQSPFIDWFTVYSWPLHPYGPPGETPGYAAWWNMSALPKFNTSAPAVREFLWDVAEYWIREGVDGWRLDVPGEIDDDPFWQEFRRRVKAANPDAYLVGEIWTDARRWLAGDQFDAVMNYLFTQACLSFFAGNGKGLQGDLVAGTGLHPLEPIDAERFRSAIEGVLGLYPWQATLSQLNLLDSHDTPRFLTIADGDDSALRLATLFQMTYPGAPCIYYGDEVGMQGGRDPDSRRAFDWDPRFWDNDLRSYVRRAVAMRHEHPVLRRGSFRVLKAEGKVFAFARQLAERTAVVAINAGNQPVTLELDLSVDSLRSVKSVWDGEAPPISGTCIRDWHLPSRSGGVLMAEMGE